MQKNTHGQVLRGFFSKYGKIVLAFVGIALATYVVMALFT